MGSKRSLDEQVAKTRDALIELFNLVRSDPRAPDPPQLVWRAMGGKVAEDIKAMKPGEIWKNHGYTSASMNPIVAYRYRPADGIVMEIKPNPNRKGIDFSVIAGNYDEQEYLMDKGSKYRLFAVPDVPFRSESGRTWLVTVYQFEEL